MTLKEALEKAWELARQGLLGTSRLTEVSAAAGFLEARGAFYRNTIASREDVVARIALDGSDLAMKQWISEHIVVKDARSRLHRVEGEQLQLLDDLERMIAMAQNRQAAQAKEEGT